MSSRGIVLVGLSGLSRCGKDTAATVLVEDFGFKQLAFADALKRGCAAMLDLPLERFYSGDREKKLPGWDFSIREFLQKMGTEAVRNTFGADFWLHTVRQRIDSEVASGRYERFVISDVRFDNEADWVRGHENSYVFHVTRPGLTAMTHASEQGIMRSDEDLHFANDGTKEQFEDKIAEWAEGVGL